MHVFINTHMASADIYPFFSVIMEPHFFREIQSTGLSKADSIPIPCAQAWALDTKPSHSECPISLAIAIGSGRAVLIESHLGHLPKSLLKCAFSLNGACVKQGGLSAVMNTVEFSMVFHEVYSSLASQPTQF